MIKLFLKSPHRFTLDFELKGLTQKKIMLKKVLKLLLVLAIVIPLVFFIGYSLIRYTSFEKIFTIKKVEVSSLKYINPKIFTKVKQQVGKSIFEFEASTYQQKLLVSSPWIESIKFFKHYPSRILIQIEEKQPLFLVYQQSKWYGILKTGEKIEWETSISLEELPVVEKMQNLDTEDFMLFVSFLDNLKKDDKMIYSNISQIVIEGADQIKIWLNQYPIWFFCSLYATHSKVMVLWQEFLKKDIDFFKNYRYLDLRVTNYGYLR